MTKLKNISRKNWVNTRIKSPYTNVCGSITKIVEKTYEEDDDDNVYVSWENGEESIVWAYVLFDFEVEHW